MTYQDRFEANIARVPFHECWEWTASLRGDGYGAFKIGKKQWGAHRLAWVLAHGEIPDGMCVCHHCDNKACVRPDHLFLGTNADNMKDLARKGGRAGERNPNASLESAQVDEIRRLSDAGVSTGEIASRFGVEKPAIWKIIHRKRWNDA